MEYNNDQQDEEEPEEANNEKMTKGKEREDIFWDTLEHNGVCFPPPYKPHGIKMKYNGKKKKRNEINSIIIIININIRMLVLLSI